jgi:hypothetical protein
MANYHLGKEGLPNIAIAGDVRAEDLTVDDNGGNHNQRQARETHVQDRTALSNHIIVMMPNGIAHSRRLSPTHTNTTEILSPSMILSLEHIIDLALQIVEEGDDLC